MSELIDDPETVVNALIDPIFDEDHYVCCKVSSGFTGFTTAYCGKQVVCDGSDVEYADSVACEDCTKAESPSYCPLGFTCTEESGNDDNME